MQKKDSDINFYIELLNYIRLYCNENDYLVVPTLIALSHWFLLMSGILDGVDAMDIEDEE